MKAMLVIRIFLIQGLMSPRESSVTGSKPFSVERESAARDDWDDVFGGGKSKPNFVGASSPIPEIETTGSGSKSDFLRQIDLMNVDQNQVRKYNNLAWAMYCHRAYNAL